MTVENSPNAGPRHWFALRVASRAEKHVAAAIRNKGFEEFLPLYRVRNRWSDRIKSLELPLFPGYIFCRLDDRSRLPILTIPGALDFVGIGKVPAPIDDAEIAVIQTAMRSGLPTEPFAFLETGQRVRLEQGPLAGLEGILLELRNQCRVVVSIPLIRGSLGVEVQRSWAAPIVPREARTFILTSDS
jgi:transcription antitermination factor NusG